MEFDIVQVFAMSGMAAEAKKKVMQCVVCGCVVFECVLFVCNKNKHKTRRFACLCVDCCLLIVFV